MAFTVHISDRDWTLVPIEKLSFKEARELKRASGGMTPAEVMRGVEGLDADATFAWLYVSIRREWPSLTMEELEHAIGDTSVVDVVSSITDMDAPEVATGPPAVAGATDAPALNGDSATTPQASTPGTSGPPTSRIQT